MTLEDTLVDLKDAPLSTAPNFRQLMAFLNGSLSRAGVQPITAATPSDQVLTAIYAIPDQEQQTAILTKEYKDMPKKDSYKSVIIATTAIIAMIVIAAVIGIVKADGPMDAQTADVFKTIGTGLIELLKLIVSGGQ